MSRIRVVGSAFTVWKVNNQPIVYCTEVSHRAPQPVAQATEIHPLNYIRPVEILVPRSITHGELVLSVVEAYNTRIWQNFGNYFGTLSQTTEVDLGDVLNAMAMNLTNADGSSQIQLNRIIRNPNGAWEVTNFNGVRIVDIRDDETARTETLQNELQMTVWYTSIDRTTVGGNNTGPGVQYGHVPDNFDY